MRLAIAGAGLIGRRHIDIIGQCEGVSAASVTDPTDAAKQYAADLNLPWYSSIAEMLFDDRPDGVIIATPNQMHVENGLECVAAGVPILVEKPIASDVASAERLVSSAEAAGVPLLVGHHRRHNPLIQEAKRRLDHGAVGQIVAVHGICWLCKPDDYYTVGWRSQPGAGPVLINLIHDVDLLRHLCGEVRAVQAMQSARTRGFAVEDTAAIIMEFESGALATVTVSDTVVAPWSWELTSGENLAYPKTEQACYTIGGTHGSLELPNGRIWSNPAERSWWQPIERQPYEVEAQDPLVLQIQHFCRVISQRETPLVSGREGLRTLALIETIQRAAASGQREVLV
jgi:predicted dehydrogenase